MMLLADSGSTKTDWCLVNNTGERKLLVSPGINPFFQNSVQIAELLHDCFDPGGLPHPDIIHYYGAGCANPEKTGIVVSALNSVFKHSRVEAASDLLGAARALCGHQAGIACILGTGSNSCHYDGESIVSNVSPLGYILGDDGSGAALGKKLITAVLRASLPGSIVSDFYRQYGINSHQILDAVYKSQFPNRYLAQYTKFLLRHITIPEMETMVTSCFAEFVSKHLLQYEQAFSSIIHFTGSIACHFKPQLINVLHQYKLQVGNIIQSPLDHLVEYHTT